MYPMEIAMMSTVSLLRTFSANASAFPSSPNRVKTFSIITVISLVTIFLFSENIPDDNNYCLVLYKRER